MTIYAYSSFTYSYLDRARVLARTLRGRHPDWRLCAIITDLPPDGAKADDLLADFDMVINTEDLMRDALPGTTKGWIFGHNIVEACTAVKGRMMEHLLDQPDAEKVLFFDPDIAIFAPLNPLLDALDTAQIILTPHQVAPDDRGNVMAIVDNEICSLHHGVFNLGFVGVSNGAEAKRFAQWWGDRLMDHCVDDLPRGLFTDQKWCNLVPCFFDDVRIIRDPGYNVASWNLSQRKVTFDPDGEPRVNDHPLRFFHFTKLGPVGDQMTRRYAHDNPEVLEIWAWYRRAVAAAHDANVPDGYWHYGQFDNGQPIPRHARRLYRDRADLQVAFRDPFRVEDGFFDWLVDNGVLDPLIDAPPAANAPEARP